MIFTNKFEALVFQGLKVGSTIVVNNTHCLVNEVDPSDQFITCTAAGTETQQRVSAADCELVIRNKPYVVVEDSLANILDD